MILNFISFEFLILFELWFFEKLSKKTKTNDYLLYEIGQVLGIHSDVSVITELHPMREFSHFIKAFKEQYLNMKYYIKCILIKSHQNSLLQFWLYPQCLLAMLWLQEYQFP